jgi:hypothetical protein
MMLPEHYSGFVLKREESLHEKSSSQSKLSWSTAGTFDKFSYWNHDTPASSMDTAPRVVEWLALADLVGISVSMIGPLLTILAAKLVHRHPSVLIQPLAKKTRLVYPHDIHPN